MRETEAGVREEMRSRNGGRFEGVGGESQALGLTSGSANWVVRRSLPVMSGMQEAEQVRVGKMLGSVWTMWGSVGHIS